MCDSSIWFKPLYPELGDRVNYLVIILGILTMPLIFKLQNKSDCYFMSMDS